MYNPSTRRLRGPSCCMRRGRQEDLPAPCSGERSRVKIIADGPQRLHLEGRAVPPQTWVVWAGLFLPGMLALLLLPESYRFVGLLGWMVIWLALIALLLRWMAITIRVTID